MSEEIIDPQTAQRIQAELLTTFKTFRLFNKGKFSDNYVKGEELGKGCFATVFKCTAKSNKSLWAVKVTTAEKCVQEKDVILQELKAQCSLPQHPNIVNLNAFFFSEGQLFIVMEIISGGDLLHRIVKLSKYSEVNASKAIKQIGLALDHLHKHLIVHRDLKLENLLLENEAEDANLKLADFGFAGKLKTQDGVLFEPCGSPGYVAPEFLESIFETEAGYGSQVDLWAVGVILYLLVSGAPPFPFEMEKLNACREGRHVYGDAFKQISDVTKDCIDKLLTHDPSKRLTAAQLLQHPFITHPELLSDSHLEQIHAELKRFNARRAFRKAVVGVVAINKFSAIATAFKAQKKK